MKRFISKVQNLSQKAAELKAAMQQVPPKVAEIREAMAATTGQLQQLKSEIQYSVADLKADDESRLTQALQEIKNSADVLARAGFVLSGLDLDISPVQRMLVRLTRVESVHPSQLRALLSANQQRKTIHAILASILQAQQMADTVELEDLDYVELGVGIGPIPAVRLSWRGEETEPAQVVPPAPTAAVPPPLASSQPQSVFGTSSFFERREPPTGTAASTQPSAPVESTAASPTALRPVSDTPAAKEAEVASDPLARFKKMPDWSKGRK